MTRWITGAFHKRIKYKSDLILYFFLCLQVALWTYTKSYPPVMGIVPNVPSKTSVKALSLGDEQFYFRILAFNLQNAGDTFGRFTALKHYNYQKLKDWFMLLDELDPKSNFIPSLAGYYFSQTQNKADLIYIIDYLEAHAERDMYHKWWWMAQASYIANHKMNNKDRALALAKKVAATKRDDLPIWAKQMPVFILEQKGEFEEAYAMIEEIVRNIDSLEPGEANFIRYFIQERLHKMIDEYPEIKQMLEDKRKKGEE